MQFKQTNNNLGDVNNAISETGNAVQSVGDHNKVTVEQPKESFWSKAWKKICSAWTWIKSLFTGGV